MTEDHSDLNLCPNCGKENLPMATRCVHCGSEMESLFTISGQSQIPDDETEDSLPDIIEEIRNDPSLQVPAEPEPNPEAQPADQPDEPTLPEDQLPDWLAKVRERAQDEEDASHHRRHAGAGVAGAGLAAATQRHNATGIINCLSYKPRIRAGSGGGRTRLNREPVRDLSNWLHRPGR